MSINNININSTYTMEGLTFKKLTDIRLRLADESRNLTADERRDLSHRFMLALDDIIEVPEANNMEGYLHITKEN